MWLIPERFVKSYPGKMVNIHPALLPKYGGKGMYGSYVHEAVVKNKEKETGITIHWVNEAYDEGNIIFQAKCDVSPSDNADDVAQKVHQLEYEHYPKVIEKAILERN
jgi:phosphoribosylglycinamide formyltransferase-1